MIGGVEGVGFKTAMKVLDKGRIHIAALSVGAATRMLEDSLQYAVERKQFGQAIANFQLIKACWQILKLKFMQRNAWCLMQRVVVMPARM